MAHECLLRDDSDAAVLDHLVEPGCGVGLVLDFGLRLGNGHQGCLYRIHRLVIGSRFREGAEDRGVGGGIGQRVADAQALQLQRRQPGIEERHLVGPRRDDRGRRCHRLARKIDQ